MPLEFMLDGQTSENEQYNKAHREASGYPIQMLAMWAHVS